jgi:sulfatase maturation enzyme AslB (radical SAM superfamily)
MHQFPDALRMYHRIKLWGSPEPYSVHTVTNALFMRESDAFLEGSLSNRACQLRCLNCWYKERRPRFKEMPLNVYFDPLIQYHRHLV